MNRLELMGENIIIEKKPALMGTTIAVITKIGQVVCGGKLVKDQNEDKKAVAKRFKTPAGKLKNKPIDNTMLGQTKKKRRHLSNLHFYRNRCQELIHCCLDKENKYEIKRGSVARRYRKSLKTC